MGKDKKEELKSFSMYKEVSGEIMALNTSLYQHIEKHLTNFFAQTNFGTRQSKGFGSFTIDQGGVNAKFPYYYFDVGTSGNSELGRQKTLFNTIDLFYRSLRSGINLLNRNQETVLYFKSLLFLYALKERDEQWDKRTIKEHFWSSKSINQRSRHLPGLEDPLGAPIKNKQPLLRDLLGLSTEQAWKADYRDNLKKESVLKDNSNPPKPLYARFKSPLFFKPIKTSESEFRVYFHIPDEIRIAFKEGNSTYANEAHFLNKEFDISFKGINGPPKRLKTPQTFDFDAFFKFAFKIDLYAHVDYAWQEHADFKTLTKVFKQLSEQV